MADPRSVLTGARLRRSVDGFLVVAAWSLAKEQGGAWQALATSDDGFQTASYERWTHDGFYELIPFEEPSEPGPPTDGLLASPAVSLHAGIVGYVLGGDGATLFPFQRTARSTDGGRSWTTFDVARVEGEMGYLTGQVVLSDGRLLVNLTNWSGDRRGHPSRAHHGLWISDGQDWGRFTPYEPPFSPPAPTTPSAEPAHQSLSATRSSAGSVVWTSGPEGLLYVSTDEAKTFTAIPAR
ncbi:hypothetical protein [Nocardioides dilutus]